MKLSKSLFKIILGLLMLISVNSCIPDNENNYGKWEFYQLNDLDSDKVISKGELDFGSSFYVNQNGYFLMSIIGINDVFSLTENSTDNITFLDPYHSDFHAQVLYGKWNNEDKRKLKLEVENYNFKTPLVFDIKKLKNKEFNFTINTSKDNNFVYQYKKTEEDTKKSEFDFVKKEYNSWRVPAKSSETDEQIRTRVLQAVDFAVVYMNYHKEQGLLAEISFLEPLPFYFAANGFRLQEDAAWEKLFYNWQEANKSYRILAEAFTKLQDKPQREFDGDSVKLITFLFEDLKEALQ